MSLLGLVGSDAKDDARRVNDQLYAELSQAQDDMKRLRQAVDQMAREYEQSKDVDAIRRYGQLKRVIKRAIMHLKLHQSNTVDDQHTAVPVGTAAVRGKDEQRKRADHATGMSMQELTDENDELAEQIKDCRRKTSMLRILMTRYNTSQDTSMLRILIEELEQNYEDSKRFIAVQRYRLMKSMIKRVTQSNLF